MVGEAANIEQRAFNYQQRKALLSELSKKREGRVPILFFNFDRGSQPANVPGLSTIFASDTKEVLYRLLKEADPKQGIDLVLYTRGGDTNSVWPLVTLIREFDPKFQVIAPFRCHSSGTLLALGANKIVMTRLAELSPIDPTTANQFNPREETNPAAPKGISVEDVRAFFSLKDEYSKNSSVDYLELFTKTVHPLALGNVQRVYLLVQNLAEVLLNSNGTPQRKPDDLKKVVKKLASEFYSHVHAIARQQATELLGPEHIVTADQELESILDRLLRSYELTFKLREQYVLKQEIKNQPSLDVNYIGAVFESEKRSYIFRTLGTWFQASKLPPGVQLNIPAGSAFPIIPGLPVEHRFDLKFQDWVHNQEGE